ncbi:hypothetical protein B0T16DRAFT_462544 [Cercophora newfieldiana]|uniref:Uncharacterized protein n=1 Tax=Cercophora newfieldiana TaxID=92897 RepID=A0AA39XRC9_9PEZI|nr:hypothetical protein B0T16DRAFT_462544 [Cercophora newfieldiana]
MLHDPPSGHAQFVLLQTPDDGQGPPPPSTQINSGHTQPALAHPVTRTVLCVVLAGLITALELTLRKSTNETGLGDVGDDTYIHSAWTTAPAIVLGTLAMVISSMDFQVRSLAPYIALKRAGGATTKRLMALNLLDASVPRILLKELRLKEFGALAATVAFLVASLFTIFSPSLFQTLTLPATVSLVLRANQSFPPSLDLSYDFASPDAPHKKGLHTASLILAGNLSYPRFTYKTLASPQFLLEPIPDRTNSDLPTISIKAVISAVRGKPHCRTYDSSQIRPNLTIEPKLNGFRLTLPVEEQYLSATFDPEGFLDITWIYASANTTYFATSDRSFDRALSYSWFYFWGKLDVNSSPAVQHVAGMGCNFTVEAVDADMTLSGIDLNIDMQHPRHL